MKPMFPNYTPPNCTFVEHAKGVDIYFAPGAIPEIILIDSSGTKTYALEPGKAGTDSLCAYAYGECKRVKLIIDKDEQEFLTHSAIGWLVMGNAGYGSDTATWPCFFTLNKERAMKYAMKVTEQVREWEANRPNSFDSPPYGWSALDPNMKSYDVPTEYSLVPTIHEADLTKIPIEDETCPECRSQIYHTPTGIICEYGHEVRA